MHYYGYRRGPKLWPIALLAVAFLLYSSRNGNWRKPVNYLKKTSGFGWRWGRPHKGTDLASRTGDKDIKAVTPGKVIYAGWLGSMGNTILIHHPQENPERISLYGHLSKITVSCDQEVRAGQDIGTMGNTGASRGIHLHLGILEKRGSGKWVYIDPETVLKLNSPDESLINTILSALPRYLRGTYTTKVPIRKLLGGGCRQGEHDPSSGAKKSKSSRVTLNNRRQKGGNRPKAKSSSSHHAPKRKTS